MGTQPMPAIEPKPPETSLLTSADPYPADYVGAQEGGFLWRTGIEFRALEANQGSRDKTCRNDGDPERYEPDDINLASFQPLAVYFPHGCEGFIGDPDEWWMEAVNKNHSNIAFQVARELWTGELTGNPSLQSPEGTDENGTPVTRDAVLVQDDDGVSPTTAVSLALANWEECAQGGIAMAHVPGVLIPDLIDKGLITRSGGRLVTPVGHIVSPGPGYPQSAGAWGPRTAATPAGEAAATGEAWVYVTSVVEIDGPYDVKTQHMHTEYIKDRMNKVLFMPEAWVSYRFDPSCVFAVKATIPT